MDFQKMKSFVVCCFQQLVSVNLADGKTGDMMVLGNIQHKLVLSPNFQTLLEESTQQQQGS